GFAGLPYEPTMAQYTGSVDVSAKPHQQMLLQPPTTGVRDWRVEMAAADVESFEHVAGDLLRELGYEAAHAPDVRGRAELTWYGVERGALRAANLRLRRSVALRR